MSLTSKAEWTPFRKLEKHYKNRAVKGRLPSLRKYKILDLGRPAKQEDDPLWRAGWWSPINDEETATSKPYKLAKGKARALGERPEDVDLELRVIKLPRGKKGYVVSDGCILIPGYLDAEEQLHLAYAALARYTRPPNPLSLSTHYELPSNLFELYQQRSDQLIHRRYEALDEAERAAIRSAPRPTRTTVDSVSGQELGLEAIKAQNQAWTGDLPSDRLKARTAEVLMQELRWANLGLVYQWSTKMYDLDPAAVIPFPGDLASVCQRVVREVDWAEVFNDYLFRPDVSTWCTGYTPDTGIVNFYGLKDTMMGHVDRAELDTSRPLISISLGHSAIFLLGSTTRDIQPVPLVLRSGDILIMSGPGRENYHGIPRILEGTLPEHFAPLDDDSSNMSAVKRWMATSRININAREVFPPSLQSAAWSKRNE